MREASRRSNCSETFVTVCYQAAIGIGVASVNESSSVCEKEGHFVRAAQLARASQIGWGGKETQRPLLVRRMELLQRVDPPTAESRTLEIDVCNEAMFGLDNSSAEYKTAMDRISVLIGQSSAGTDMEKYEQAYAAANADAWQCEGHTARVLFCSVLFTVHMLTAIRIE